MLGQQFGRFIFADCGNREQDVLGGNVLIFELLGFDKGTLQNFVRCRLNCCCATPVTFGRRAKSASISQLMFRADAQAGQQRRNDPVALRHESSQEMQRLDLLMIVPGCDLLRRLNCFLRL